MAALGDLKMKLKIKIEGQSRKQELEQGAKVLKGVSETLDLIEEMLEEKNRSKPAETRRGIRGCLFDPLVEKYAVQIWRLYGDLKNEKI